MRSASWKSVVKWSWQR